MPRKETRPKVPSETTAGVSRMNESTRRPLIGRFRICAWVTTCELPVSVWEMMGVDEITSTVVAAAATARGMFRLTFWPTRISRSDRSYA